MFDAEGSFENEHCPECGSTDTVTYSYREGFSELECRACGYRSDHEDLSELQRFSGDLLEGDESRPLPVPIKSIKA